MKSVKWRPAGERLTATSSMLFEQVFDWCVALQRWATNGIGKEE